MTQKTVTVRNKSGIHARPATIIVQTAQKYDCSIWFEKDSTQVNAKSIMNILALGAAYQTELTICAEGSREEAAVTELVDLFDNQFKNV